ncbi:unnamed protein product, partial [Vitis vinifera]
MWIESKTIGPPCAAVGMAESGPHQVRIRIRSALRVEGGIAAKDVAQIAGKVNEIGAGVDPTVKIGDGDHTGGVDMRVRALDDHVASGVDVDARGAGVVFGEGEEVLADEPFDVFSMGLPFATAERGRGICCRRKS